MIIKKRNYFLKIFSSLMIMIFFLSSSHVFAQQLPQQQQQPQQAEYSDDELIVFINAAQQVMPLQQESQSKMIGEIEKEELSVDKFNTIMDAHSEGAEIDATSEELEAFNVALEGIQEIQMEYEVIITKTIEDEGITPAKYQEIMTNYQQNPDLQMRINVLMEDMQEE
ncbi:MAG: DUF4168 domain-containing protein [Bacteroidales bacterium]